MNKTELQTYANKTGYNLAQTELDYYQHAILAELFRKYNKLYFKGGTCLQKCYGIKRFSEDLDFNYEDIDINDIIKTIETYFATKITDRYDTRFGTTFTIRIQGPLYDGTARTTCKLSFDFREGDTYQEPLKQVINPIYKDLPRYLILALAEEEIAAEKIRAIITRYKARDVYDLNELINNNVRLREELINKKLKSYEKTLDKEELKEKIEEKRTIYDEEMKRLTNFYEDFDNCKEQILKAI